MRMAKEHSDETERNFATEDQQDLWARISTHDIFTNIENEEYFRCRMYLTQQLEKSDILLETFTNVFTSSATSHLKGAILSIAEAYEPQGSSSLSDYSYTFTAIKDIIENPEFTQKVIGADFTSSHYEIFAQFAGKLSHLYLYDELANKALKDMFHHAIEKTKTSATYFITKWSKAHASTNYEGKEEADAP